MILIDVTHVHGWPLTLNAERIAGIEPTGSGAGCFITFEADRESQNQSTNEITKHYECGYPVKETIEEVKALIAAASNPNEVCIPAARNKNTIRKGAILTRCYKCNRLVELGEDCVCEESEAVE